MLHHGRAMDEPDVIPEAAVIYLLAARKQAFDRFCAKYDLRPMKLAGGVVYRRSAVYAAIEKALADAESREVAA